LEVAAFNISASISRTLWKYDKLALQMNFHLSTRAIILSWGRFALGLVSMCAVPYNQQLQKMGT